MSQDFIGRVTIPTDVDVSSGDAGAVRNAGAPTRCGTATARIFRIELKDVEAEGLFHLLHHQEGQCLG